MFFRQIFGAGTDGEDRPLAIRRAFTTGKFGPLGSERTDGRLIVHSIDEPRPAPGRIVAEVGNLSIREFPNLLVARKVKWRDIEFTDGRLPRTSLQNCSLQNVVFRRCELTSWRFFSVQARDCIFSDTNLHGTAFSVMTDQEETVFSRCRFIRCDLRETAYKRVRFEHCRFVHCRISDVHFDTAAFVDVEFLGRINDSQFRGVRAGHAWVNPMLRVDFSAAQLSWVDFYSIDLSHVRFPVGENQITVENWPAFLDALDEMTADRTETEFRGVHAMTGGWKKSRGPHQNRGFINLDDIARDVGPIALEIFKTAIETSRK